MASLFSDRTGGSLQICGFGQEGESPCHMSLLGFTLLELHPLPISLVLSVFLGRTISLQTITTPLQKQQACLGEARTAQTLPGRKSKSQGFFPDFPSHPVASRCYLQLYPLCLALKRFNCFHLCLYGSCNDLPQQELPAARGKMLI